MATEPFQVAKEIAAESNPAIKTQWQKSHLGHILSDLTIIEGASKMSNRLSVREVAERLGITVQAVHKKISTGSLNARKINNHWLVDERSVKEAEKKPSHPGRRRKGKTFFLMNRTHEVMEFSFDEQSGNFLPREVFDSQRAPIGAVTRNGKGSANGLKTWWEHRSIPESRTGMDRKLAELGVANASDIPFRNLGLSLSDQYWVKPEGQDIAWEAVNYFNNDFGNSGTCWDEWLSEVGLSSPDNTSEGVLPKKWICENKQRILLKGHIPWTDQQVYNEAVATALHHRVLESREFVPYKVKTFEKLGVVSACSCFLKDDEEYVPASLIDDVESSLRGESTYEALVRKSCNLGIASREVRMRLSKMVVCDSLLANTDRHLRNFGYIRNVETLEWRFAPLFDSGNSLWYDKDESAVARGDYSFISRPFDPTPNKQLILAAMDDWFDLSLLDGFAEEAINILSRGNLSRWRTDYLKAGIEKRISVLRMLWE